MSREFIMPKNIITGENSLELAKSYIKDMGKKAFIVTGRTVVPLICFDKVKLMLEELKIEYIVLAEITGEPT